MDLTPYLQQLRDDLLAAVALADEQTRRTATAVVAALEPSARLALMNALSDLAAEVTGALDDTTVEITLNGRDVRVVVQDHSRTDEQAGSPDATAAEDASAPGDEDRPWWFPHGGRPGSRPRRPRAGFDPTGDADPTSAGDPDTAGGPTSGHGLKDAVDEAAGELSRTTVRLFQDLKGRAEAAAAAQGVSLNTFISRAVQDSVSGKVPKGWPTGPWAGRAEKRPDAPRRPDGPTRRVTGWIQT